MISTIQESKFAGWKKFAGWGKFASWEGWLAPAGSIGSTSNVYFRLTRKLSLLNQRGQATLPNLRICFLEFSLRCRQLSTAILVLAIILAAMSLGGCQFGVGAKHLSPTTESLLQEEKHKLYSAALAASDSPLDTELFKVACKQIGIFDADGNPNGTYLAFVQEHIAWGMRAETNQFRLQINTKERAQEYVLKHLP